MGIALITNNIVSDSNIAIAALSPSYAAGGVTSTGVSTLVFSNANGVSFGMNGSTVTASAAGGGGGAVTHQSYFEHMYMPNANNGSIAIGTGVGSAAALNYLQPFALPYDVSVSYIRMPIQISFATASAATGNSTLSYAHSHSQTFFFNIYTMGTGASSASLQLYASASASMNMAFSVSYANSNAQTIFHSVSYPIAGSSSSATYSFASNTAQIYMGSGGMTAITGAKQFDIPFASSLPTGDYWVAMQRSTASSASTQVSATVSAINLNFSNFGIVQVSPFGRLGINGNTTDGAQIGVGAYSASASGATTASIALSLVSTYGSQFRFPFQMIRQA